MSEQRGDLTSAATAVPTTGNKGWTVTFAGTGINLALGILYTWSVLSAAIQKADWGWTEAERSLPYSIACLSFAFATIPAGRLQDVIGPRWVSTAGGVLVGIGMIMASLSTSPLGFVVGFGILAGAGIGFGYACATPPAVKWFGPAKTGLIAGIVVSGFGLASVWAAPAAEALTNSSYGVSGTMLIFGIGFLIVVAALSQILRNPPAGYVPSDGGAGKAAGASKPKVQEEYSPGRMLRTPQFWMMWFMYFCGAGAGLMIISKMAKITNEQAGLALGFVLVAVLAIGNGGGRIIAGFASDKIGRTKTLLIVFVAQAVLMILVSQATQGSILASPVVLGIIAALMGANYGANLAVFPSITKDWFGLKNFGANYGFVFTAWGVGGFVMSLIAGTLYDATHSFNQAYFLAAGLLIVVAVLTFLLRPPKAMSAAAEAR